MWLFSSLRRVGAQLLVDYIEHYRDYHFKFDVINPWLVFSLGLFLSISVALFVFMPIYTFMGTE